jgi:hypothetical protein
MTKGHIFTSLNPAKPTVVFDTLWRFAAERQKIFFARARRKQQPWTRDVILQTHKFTNAYRASDRVSQFLIRHVIYADNGIATPDELFFRIIFFKLFNKIETWKLIEQEFGQVTYQTYRYKHYDRVLSQALRQGFTIYSPAYIMASGHRIFRVPRKHQAHLRLLELMISKSVPQRLAECRTMRQGFEILRSYPLIGDFLGYQLITDLNYSELTDFSETEFTIPGPGARDGIRKCFASLGGLSEVDIIRLMVDRQEYEFERLGINFLSLWGRRLQLIDMQNLFCEVDKYARLKHPEILGISGRTRIKQKFRETRDSIDYFYPPKWELNMRRAKKSYG